MRNYRFCIALVLMASWSCAVGAEGQSTADLGTKGPWLFSFGLGGFSPASSEELKNQSGQYSVLVGGEYRYSKNLSFDVDLWAADQRIDTPSNVVAPFFGTVDGRATISTGAISFVAKLVWPMDRFEPYIGAGGGLFFSRLYISGSVFGMPASHEETDTSLGGLLLGGVDIWVAQNWAIGAEFRHVSVKANFGNVIPGDVNVGGNSVMATLHWRPAGYR